MSLDFQRASYVKICYIWQHKNRLMLHWLTWCVPNTVADQSFRLNGDHQNAWIIRSPKYQICPKINYYYTSGQKWYAVFLDCHFRRYLQFRAIIVQDSSASRSDDIFGTVPSTLSFAWLVPDPRASTSSSILGTMPSMLSYHCVETLWLVDASSASHEKYHNNESIFSKWSFKNAPRFVNACCCTHISLSLA